MVEFTISMEIYLIQQDDNIHLTLQKFDRTSPANPFFVQKLIKKLIQRENQPKNMKTICTTEKANETCLVGLG